MRKPTCSDCCETCANCLKVERYNYKEGGGVDHIPMEGFICIAFACEGWATWMTGNIDKRVDFCEEWRERKERSGSE